MVNEQWVIVYVTRGERIIYSTAYDIDEGKRQVELCANRHGPACQAKAVTAASIPFEP